MARKSATAEAGNAEWDAIEIGDQVKHAKWGVGTVLFRSGMGEAAKAIVVFPEEGQKKLMLKYAGLVKVGSTSLKSVEKLKAGAEQPKIKIAAPKIEEDEAEVESDGDEDELLLDDDEDIAGFDDDDDEFAGRDEDDED